ncbi:putative uncharacterized protein encoded by LINC01465 [Orcinus orca]|uniref:putative uncharacterized protein encoded by LINC01465 n=1 Tax=Orcinus orca TaxID=9733 RepID=UPI001441F26B|nr:putative uncharacterized protein encoded by LINC01465 [Orcinus orca]
MGGKSTADAYGTWTVPERQQAALPRFARRAPATSPGCAARSPPCGGGWAAAGPPPLPRSLHPREAGSPPGRTPERFPQRQHRLRRRNQKPRHSPEVPRPPAPQHPSGKSRAPLQEARIKQKPRKTETGPGGGMGGSGSGSSRRARTHAPSRAPLLQ